MGAATETPDADLAVEDVDVNRRYFFELVESAQARAGRALRVLDFGSGAAELVELLQRAGVDCYGADVLWEGAAYGNSALPELLDRGIVREIPADGRLPFDDASFDVIISDQVFEHVEDLDAVLAELDRVLRREGVMHHHFPSREVLREPHLGIPLAHRFPAGRLRFAYTLALRSLGLGTHKGDRSIRQWTQWKLNWMDRFTFYRSSRELNSLFARRHTVRHREIDYCRFRAAEHRFLSRMLSLERLEGLYERVFRRLGFMAVELRKRSAPDHSTRPASLR